MPHLVPGARVPIGSAIHGSVHAVQFYETDDYLMETLAAYVGGGLAEREAVIVVASAPHRDALEERLAFQGIDVPGTKRSGALVVLDADELLSRFTVDGTISAPAFMEIVGGLVARARKEGTRPVRVFGEMVALLWARGSQNAALFLEELWNELTRRMSFPLLCAYPVSAFSAYDRADGLVAEVTVAHERGADARN